MSNLNDFQAANPMNDHNGSQRGRWMVKGDFKFLGWCQEQVWYRWNDEVYAAAMIEIRSSGVLISNHSDDTQHMIQMSRMQWCADVLMSRFDGVDKWSDARVMADVMVTWWWWITCHILAVGGPGVLQMVELSLELNPGPHIGRHCQSPTE